MAYLVVLLPIAEFHLKSEPIDHFVKFQDIQRYLLYADKKIYPPNEIGQQFFSDSP